MLCFLKKEKKSLKLLCEFLCYSMNLHCYIFQGNCKKKKENTANELVFCWVWRFSLRPNRCCFWKKEEKRNECKDLTDEEVIHLYFLWLLLFYLFFLQQERNTLWWSWLHLYVIRSVTEVLLKHSYPLTIWCFLFNLLIFFAFILFHFLWNK